MRRVIPFADAMFFVFVIIVFDLVSLWWRTRVEVIHYIDEDICVGFAFLLVYFMFGKKVRTEELK